MNNLNLYSETVSGYTAVSDLFIDEYVPSANGDFVKVYLYLLRLLTRKNSSLSISSLADTFNQTENDVMRALRYWDKSGLVCLSYDDNNQLCGITVKDLRIILLLSLTEAVMLHPNLITTLLIPRFLPLLSPMKLPLMRLLQMYRQMLFLWILPLKHHHILLSLQR